MNISLGYINIEHVYSVYSNNSSAAFRYVKSFQYNMINIST